MMASVGRVTGAAGGAVASPVARSSCWRSSPCWYFSSQYICVSWSSRFIAARPRRQATSMAIAIAPVTNQRKVT